MRNPFAYATLAIVAMLSLTQVALAIPPPAIATPVPPTATLLYLPSAAPSAAPAFAVVAAVGMAFGWGAWVLAHWQAIGELLAALVAIYTAVKTHQWGRLVAEAGRVTFNLATLTNLDGDQKRAEAEKKLYANAGPIARALFTEAQFMLAVETGYKLIAKPQLKAPDA